jgi:hypothetical protein
MKAARWGCGTRRWAAVGALPNPSRRHSAVWTRSIGFFALVVATLNFASWNQITAWLTTVDELRRAA